MMVDARVAVDVRNLFSVHTTSVSVTDDKVNVNFTLKSNKSLSTLPLTVEWSVSSEDVQEDRSELIKRAWNRVVRCDGALSTSSSWEELKQWAINEASKPSVHHTVDI